MSYGTPMFFNSLCIGLTTAALNAAFLQYGSDIYVAAYTIVSKIGGILLCFCYGMSELTATVTGIINGEEDRDGLKEILQIMSKKAVTINLVLIAVTWIAAYWSVKIFTVDATIIALATFGLKLFALQFIFRSLIMCYVGYLRGLQKILASNVILAVLTISSAFFAFNAPLCFGTESIWYSYVVSTIFSLIFVMVFVGYLTKKNPFAWDNLILKSNNYGITKENFLEWEITYIKNLCSCCEKASDFVKSHGGDNRKSYLLSLFMEELGKNVLTWAFRDGKEHRLTIKIMYSSEGFKLRFRDDGVHFNPADYYKIHKGEIPGENFGIRMVFAMNPEVTYLNTMNLNNLLVTIR